MFKFKKPSAPSAKSGGAFSRLKDGLSRTRQAMFGGMASLFLGKKVIDASVLEELETRMLLADVGVQATQGIVADLQQEVKRRDLNDPQILFETLQQKLVALLEPCSVPLNINTDHKPYVILMVGVNGSGKTTTIGKLALQLREQGKKVLLAAGDTFRAAAIDQLKVWGERNSIGVIAQQPGSDSAAVIFDAMQAAQARNIDVLIADTAGRLHTQSHLMEELKKIKRVIAKVDSSAPHEIMLILDASIGQNALVQARQFNEAVGVTGLTLTKLDGTAKGGIVFAIAEELKLPIRYIGIGEKIEDLREFDAPQFVEALLS